MRTNFLIIGIIALLAIGGGAYALGNHNAQKNDTMIESNAMQKQKAEDAAMQKEADDAAAVKMTETEATTNNDVMTKTDNATETPGDAMAR